MLSGNRDLVSKDRRHGIWIGSIRPMPLSRMLSIQTCRTALVIEGFLFSRLCYPKMHNACTNSLTLCKCPVEYCYPHVTEEETEAWGNASL